MAISTVQVGNFKINGEVTPELVSYINNFSASRRMKRSNKKIKKLYPNWKNCCLNGELGTDGEYFVCPEERKKDSSILDCNISPATQPSLWCDWKIVEENGNYYIRWNGYEGFAYPVPWLGYLRDNFFIPSGGLSLSGASVSVGGQGDVFIIVVNNNEFSYYALDNGDTTASSINELKKEYDNADIINAFDEILSHADDIDTLFSLDTDYDEWEEVFEKYFKED